MKKAKVRKIEDKDQELIDQVFKILDDHRCNGKKPMGNWCYRDHIRNTAEFIVTGPIADILRGKNEK